MTWQPEAWAASAKANRAKAQARRSVPLPEFIRRNFSYDETTGMITRVGSRAVRLGKCRLGIGTISNGYWWICVRGHQIGAHRIAWMHHYGEEPSGIIDHINGDPLDNRIINLRVVDRVGHAVNRRHSHNSSSGLKGVHFHSGAGRWRAQIAIGGQRKHLGYFDTAEQAKAAYDAESLRVHGPLAEAYRRVAP